MIFLWWQQIEEGWQNRFIKPNHFPKKSRLQTLMQKKKLRAVPTLFLFSARSAEKIFFGDSNTRAFCAEGAEKIFYMIATQEPFGAEGAKRFFLSKTRSRNGAQKVSTYASKRSVSSTFSPSGKIFEKVRGPIWYKRPAGA